MNEPITTTDPDEPEPGGATSYDTAFVRRCATDETYNGELLSARDFNSWLARVKAEALREAADEMGAECFCCPASEVSPMPAPAWLRDHADRIERGE